MANPPPYPDSGVSPTEDRPPGIPRWVKVSGIIVGILVLLFVVLQLTGVGPGAGGHGPGRHSPGGDHEGNTPPIDGAPQLASDRIELPTGKPVNVALTSADTLHDLVVDEIDFYLAAERDETVIGGLVFYEPVTYVGYCSVLGHRESGMELELVVTPSGDDTPGGHTPPGGGH